MYCRFKLLMSCMCEFVRVHAFLVLLTGFVTSSLVPNMEAQTRWNLFQNPTQTQIDPSSNLNTGGVGTFQNNGPTSPLTTWHMYHDGTIASQPCLLRLQYGGGNPTSDLSTPNCGIQFHVGRISNPTEYRAASILPIAYQTTNCFPSGGLTFTTNADATNGFSSVPCNGPLIDGKQIEMLRMTSQGTGILLPSSVTVPADALQIGDRVVTHIGDPGAFIGFNQFWAAHAIGGNYPERMVSENSPSMALLFNKWWNTLELLNCGSGDNATSREVFWNESDNSPKGICIGSTGTTVDNSDHALVGIGCVAFPNVRLDVHGFGESFSTSSLRVRNRINSNLLVVQDDGHIGIGTSQPPVIKPNLLINDVMCLNSVGPTLFIGANAYFSGSTWKYVTEANSTTQRRSAGLFLWDGNVSLVPTSSNGNIDDPIAEFNSSSSIRDGIFLQNTGNVGIGCAYAGASRLKIVGKTTGSNSNTLLLSNASGSDLFTVRDDGNIGVSVSPSDNRLTVKGSSSEASSSALQVQNSSGSILFNVRNDGHVSVGSSCNTTTIPQSVNAKMSVDGVVFAREMRVTVNNWPDYVFSCYKLDSLSDVIEYAKANGHLPDIPSAASVAENGVDLGKMTSLLLKKVEELTLHVARIDAENKALRQRIEASMK